MIKKLTIYVLALATLVLFTGCEMPDTDKDTDTIESEVRSYTVVDYKDPETGVHYLIFEDGYRGGLSVRYNADGTIMVD
jgi:hypothetical protein